MRTVEFRQLFDDKNAARVRFELERGQVLKLVVQLECRFNDEWHPVARYDTAHDFAHRDLLHPSGTAEKTEMPTRDVTIQPLGLDCQIQAREVTKRAWSGQRSRRIWRSAGSG